MCRSATKPAGDLAVTAYRIDETRIEMERSVKLSDVAAIAGVSTATVSRCLNRPERVSADLRARVRTAIDALGYVPDAAARALRSEEHTSELQSLMRISYAVFCLKKKTNKNTSDEL